MTSREKLADLLYQYTCAWNRGKENHISDSGFRELCRDLHGDLGAWIEKSKPEPKKPEIRRTVRVETAKMVGWGGV